MDREGLRQGEATMKKLADFPQEMLDRIVPKNEDGERCWLSYADKAKLNLGWV